MIKQRNMGMQVLLMIITLGIYGIYWLYVTSKEMVEYKRLDGSPGLWTVLSLIPFVNLYADYKQGEAVEAHGRKRQQMDHIHPVAGLFSCCLVYYSDGAEQTGF